MELNQRNEQFLPGKQTKLYQALRLLPFESYTLNRHAKPLAISPYTSALAPLPIQLPGAQHSSSITFTLSLPPATTGQRLGVTLPPSSQVFLDDKALVAESKTPAQVIDNRVYAIPAAKSSRQLVIVVTGTVRQNRLAVRLLNPTPNDRAQCLKSLGIEEEAYHPNWLSVLWAFRT